jgi:hypothetical protein
MQDKVLNKNEQNKSFSVKNRQVDNLWAVSVHK